MTKKFITIFAIIATASVLLTACAQQKETDITAESEAVTTMAETAQRSDMHDNEIIVMENFFVGYLIDNEEQFLKDAIADGYKDNAISDVLTRGQRYHDNDTNTNFAIVRKKGNEDIFDLPPAKVTVYDLRGYSYHDITYNVSLNSFNASETISTGYGDIELRYPE